MKKLLSIATISIAIVVLQLLSCRPDDKPTDVVPDTSNDITFSIPNGWPQPVYNFDNNALSQAGFELGRKLFYDTRLSRDNSTSCATCHQQFAAFSQLDHPVSHGVDGKLGTRNSPALFNLNWHSSFFWDGGVNHIEVQPASPIQNPVEMDEKLENVITKLNADTAYQSKFKAAFGSTEINSQKMLKALAQFMGAMVSSNSKYDKHERGEADGTFTEEEERGLAFFRQNCAGCHKEPLFSDFSFRNNGLKPDSRINDSGRAHITLQAEDMYKFKVPSLRNISLTYPYMHDGRFNTLDQVLNHYATGIYQSATLDTLLKTGITMTDQDKADLKAFLLTLEDKDFVKDKRFTDPK